MWIIMCFPGFRGHPSSLRQGHAFHGTYWHENFGAPMSHGCINMRTEEANWVFRWVQSRTSGAYSDGLPLAAWAQLSKSIINFFLDFPSQT
jgi:hypothetical protein